MSGTYADLEVWNLAMDFAVKIYQMTNRFPREEMYGLTSQVRRAAVSIASNIAEGKGRASDREFVQFLCHARGSLFEVETQLRIAQQLGYAEESECDDLGKTATSIGRMLNGLIRSVRPKPEARSPKPSTD